MTYKELQQLPKWLRERLRVHTTAVNKANEQAEAAWQRRESAVAALLSARSVQAAKAEDFETTLGACREWLEANHPVSEYEI